MTIGMANVRLSHIPRHVGRRPGHVQPLLDAAAVHFVHVVYENRDPDPFVAALIALRSERHLIRAFAAGALTALAQEDLIVVAINRSERGWIPPFKSFKQAKFLEP